MKMIGEYIKKARLEKGLSLTETAKKADIAKSYLSNIERDVNKNPSLKVLEKLANVLEIDLSDFVQKVQVSHQHEDNEWYHIVDELRTMKVKKSQMDEYKLLLDYIKWRNMAE